VAVASSLTLVLGACASSPQNPTESPGASEGEYTQADLDAALAEGGEIDLWAWGAQYEKLSELIMTKFPEVKVNYLNPGNGGDTMTKLQNAVAANSGIPDVVMMEYKSMPQFAASDSLLSLDDYGIDFSAYSPAASLEVDGTHVGLPMDAGPLVMYYRADIFEAAGIEVPTTWEEHEQAGKKLKAHDPEAFMSWHTQAGADAYIWQAGGVPYEVDGEKLKIDLGVEPAQRWGDMWTRFIDDGLLDTSVAWLSAEWTSNMEAGKYASWVAGAWAVGTLQNRFPAQSGLWRAAPVPQYEASAPTNGVDGGSGVVVPKGTDTPLLSVAVAKWMTTSEDAQNYWVENAGVPMTIATQTSPGWLDAEYEYYGGQQVNQVIVDAMDSVGEGWTFLPFGAYSNALYSDIVIPQMAPGESVSDALIEWHDALRAYAADQGYTLVD